MPDIKGKQYVSVYEEVISETETAMVKEEIAPTVQEDIISVSQEEESNLFQKITQWIREHLTVATVRLTVLIGFFGCLILLWMKNSKDKKSREH